MVMGRDDGDDDELMMMMMMLIIIKTYKGESYLIT